MKAGTRVEETEAIREREEVLSSSPAPYTLPADEAGYGWGATSPAAYVMSNFACLVRGKAPHLV